MGMVRVTITNEDGEVFATHEIPPMSVKEWAKQDFRWLDHDVEYMLDDLRTACHRAHMGRDGSAPSE